MVAKIKKQFDSMKFIKKIVIFCILFITIYTITAIIFQAVTGDVLSDTLTERVFTTLIGELCITGVLKIFEGVSDRFGKKDDNSEDDDEETYVDMFEGIENIESSDK